MEAANVFSLHTHTGNIDNATNQAPSQGWLEGGADTQGIKFEMHDLMLFTKKTQKNMHH